MSDELPNAGSGVLDVCQEESSELAARKAKEAKVRSGTVWGDEDYEAAGYVKFTCRLPEDTAKDLERLAQPLGGRKFRTKVLIDLITEAAKKLKRRS